VFIDAILARVTPFTDAMLALATPLKEAKLSGPSAAGVSVAASCFRG
jgi:hypothetical protein